MSSSTRVSTSKVGKLLEANSVRNESDIQYFWLFRISEIIFSDIVIFQLYNIFQNLNSQKKAISRKIKISNIIRYPEKYPEKNYFGSLCFSYYLSSNLANPSWKNYIRNYFSGHPVSEIIQKYPIYPYPFRTLVKTSKQTQILSSKLP